MDKWFFPESDAGDQTSAKPMRGVVLEIFVLALAYYATARLCLIFALGNTNVTPVWLPSGLALAAVWILGYRVWPGIFLGAFSANISAFLSHHFADIWTIGGISYLLAIGNTLESVGICLLLKRFVKTANPLNSVDDVLKFVFFTLAVCLADALFGPTALCLSGHISWHFFPRMVTTWWMGDAAGIITVSPILFVLQQYNRTKWKNKYIFEVALLSAVLVFVNYGIFWQGFFIAKAYILLPVILYAAYRFGVIGASLATLLTLGIAMAGTISGMGPFAHVDLNLSLLTLLGFVAVMSITGLILAATIKDRYWALEKAGKEEQRYRSLVENSSDMISVLSADAHILYASPSTIKILGYSQEEYIGTNCFDYIHPQDVGLIMKLLSQLLLDPGKGVVGGCRYRHKDGTWRYLEGTGNNMLLNPAVHGIVVNYRDVTDRKKTEHDQLYLSSIIENSDDAIYGKSLKGIIMSWNKGADRIFGYSAAEIVGQSVDVLVPEERRQELQKVFLNLKAGRKVNIIETVRRRKDGQDIYVSMSISPINDQSGSLIGYSTIARDISERKKTETALRESESRFRNMADTAPVMIWMSGRDTLFNFFNKALFDFTGQTPERGMGSGWTDHIHPDDVQRYRDRYLTAFDHREKFTIDYRLRRWDGEYRWVLDTGVPRINGGKFEGYIGSCVDITEQKLAEEVLARQAESLKKSVEERSRELNKAQEELKKANRLAEIGTLAATVAHELRNPLGVIQMAAFNLKRRHQELAEDRHITNIEKKVWEGERIINNLLTYASIKVPRYEEIPLVKTLDDCLTAIQNRFQDATVTVERRYDVEPMFSIEADQLQMIEVFNNILMNAYQAFPEKKGTLQLQVARHEGSVKVLVKDSGMGIEQEDMDKVFVPFFTKKAKGTGLGLAICNELVHLHNGTIEIASEIGKGTTVIVDFPIRQGKS
jgi:two-component system sporulation sensor kinase A